jgi:hypothetical protein
MSLNIKKIIQEEAIRLHNIKKLQEQKSILENSIENLEKNQTEFSEPDFDNDFFIEDVPFKGYKLSGGGKYIDICDDIEECLKKAKKIINKDKIYYDNAEITPLIWFISDSGNTWPIDLNGNEIVTEQNEKDDEIEDDEPTISAKMVIMSHLSDIQEVSPKDVIQKINFVKDLINKYEKDLNTQINPRKEWLWSDIF